ncbi:MAG TPA: hypothetical protein VF651_09110 [Gammaproteobacteria bacterium]
MDVAQSLEDVLEELTSIQKEVNKLTTASVSGQSLRGRVKDTYKKYWLPVVGVLESSSIVDTADVQDVSENWKALVKLASAASPRAQYKALLKAIIGKVENELLYTYIKGSAIQTIGDVLRKLVQPVSDPALLKYLDESIQCAETGCIRASVVLAWCAIAFRIQKKLASLGITTLNAEFAKMKADNGLMFKTFTKPYVFSSDLDVQEAADAHLILLCRFLLYLDDTQYKHLKAALDLRNGCGHPTGYQPDPVKLQAYYADITQLVLLNPKFN